jgi:hypothetical protein
LKSTIRSEIRKVAGIGANHGRLTSFGFAAWDNYTEARIDAVTALVIEDAATLPMLNAYYVIANYPPH